jgi:hypothetical protein
MRHLKYPEYRNINVVEINYFMKMTVFWVIALCSQAEVYRSFRGILAIALMMEAARTSETSVNFHQTTWRYNPELTAMRTSNPTKLFNISLRAE